MAAQTDEDAPRQIRTPDQRLRVFVSSTLNELADERAAVVRAIEALRLTPVMFELGARPHPPRELYRAYLAQSDIFIGLYWQQYGWIGPDMDVSGLEDEFRLSRGKPRLLYVKRPAPDRDSRLTAMLESLQADGTESYRPFRTPDELDAVVRDDLALLLSERFIEQPERHEVAARPLPVTATSLIGREQEIHEVSELLDAPDVRLVTLTGPGGIGKTRLAIAVAEQVQARLADGVSFVGLGSITEPALVMSEIASVLGASLEGSRPALEAVADQIGDRPTLLVLDNLEQVLGVGPALDELLQRCSALEILATSRSLLRLRAEHEYPVGALTAPAFDTPPPPEELAAFPAVQLFVERARANRFGFALTPENAHAVAEICRRLDGLPLAIELAAARVRLLDPVTLLARLERGLDALGTGPIDLPARQRTLRATVEWSLGLLRDDERQMLATMAVFVEGWSIHAATTVGGVDEDETLDLLDALTRHSLVRVDIAEHGPRFSMLETIRELAAEHLAGMAAREEIEARHARYFGDLVIGAPWPLDGQDDWSDRLRLDDGNVRRAIRWFFDHDVRPLPHMFRVLWWFWQLNDRMRDGRAWLEELLPRADSLDEAAQIELYLTAAVTGIEVGDDDGSLAAAREIERLQDRIDDPLLASWAHLALAWTRPIEGDIDGALTAGYRALEGFRALEEPFLEGSALMTVGMLELGQGRADVARPFLYEVQAIGARFRNNWLASGGQVQLAVIATQEGRFEEARAQLQEAMDAADQTQISTHTLSFCLVALAQLTLAEGDVTTAATALGAAEGARQRAGIRAWPSLRRGEALLIEHVRHQLGPDAFDDAFARGFSLDRRQAGALLRPGPSDR